MMPDCRDSIPRASPEQRIPFCLKDRRLKTVIFNGRTNSFAVGRLGNSVNPLDTQKQKAVLRAIILDL